MLPVAALHLHRRPKSLVFREQLVAHHRVFHREQMLWVITLLVLNPFLEDSTGVLFEEGVIRLSQVYYDSFWQFAIVTFFHNVRYTEHGQSSTPVYGRNNKRTPYKFSAKSGYSSTELSRRHQFKNSRRKTVARIAATSYRLFLGPAFYFTVACCSCRIE